MSSQMIDENGFISLCILSSSLYFLLLVELMVYNLIASFLSYFYQRHFSGKNLE